MKRIFVEILGRETEPVDIEISPGDTAGAILSHMQLAEYVLATFSMFNADWWDKDSFSEEEVVYDQVGEDERLVALHFVEAADRYMNKIAFGEAESFQEARMRLQKKSMRRI